MNRKVHLILKVLLKWKPLVFFLSFDWFAESFVHDFDICLYIWCCQRLDNIRNIILYKQTGSQEWIKQHNFEEKKNSKPS